MRLPRRKREKLRVLFVDDDEVVRKVWGYCFGTTFVSTIAASAEEALRLLEHPPHGVPFDVLVADHRMPEMTGAELCWRAAEIAPETARIVVTAFRDPEARACPARVVLEKPWEEARMLEVIHDASNGSAPSEDDVLHRREREAEEALKDARAEFRETTAELRSWEPAKGGA